jgi:hypothetical protein
MSTFKQQISSSVHYENPKKHSVSCELNGDGACLSDDISNISRALTRAGLGHRLKCRSNFSVQLSKCTLLPRLAAAALELLPCPHTFTWTLSARVKHHKPLEPHLTKKTTCDDGALKLASPKVMTSNLKLQAAKTQLPAFLHSRTHHCIPRPSTCGSSGCFSISSLRVQFAAVRAFIGQIGAA